MKIKKLLQFLIVYIVTIAVLYLLVSFYFLTTNPAAWSEEARFLLCLFSVGVLLILVFNIDDLLP